MTLYLVDTSVAVPLVLTSHAAHGRTNAVVAKRAVHLAGHAAFETYSVLTRLPGDARLAPDDAVTLLHDRFETIVSPDPAKTVDPLARLALAGVAGGAVYDSLIALAALVRPESVLLSRDVRAAATYARLGATVELVTDR